MPHWHLTTCAGMVCAAQYEDEVWYRCCVEAVDLLDTTTFVTVNYTDYGNSEQVTLGRCV